MLDVARGTIPMTKVEIFSTARARVFLIGRNFYLSLFWKVKCNFLLTILINLPGERSSAEQTYSFTHSYYIARMTEHTIPNLLDYNKSCQAFSSVLSRHRESYVKTEEISKLQVCRTNKCIQSLAVLSEGPQMAEPLF